MDAEVGSRVGEHDRRAERAPRRRRPQEPADNGAVIRDEGDGVAAEGQARVVGGVGPVAESGRHGPLSHGRTLVRVSTATDRVLPFVAAVVLAGAAAAAVLLPDTDFATETPERASAVEPFVAAWERSRTETYVVEWQFTRLTPGGGELEYRSSLAQRPPDDRLLVGFGSVEGRLGGRALRCGTDPDGQNALLPRTAGAAIRRRGRRRARSAPVVRRG